MTNICFNENMSTKKCLPNDKIFPKSSDIGLLRFRRTIKMRVDRCQGILKKIDHDSKLMRLCFRQLMDLMDDCRKIVKVEQELNMHLLQLLDGYNSGNIDLSAKTQTVSPMVAGYPLKKASIMLKRLDPLRELQSNNNLGESNRSQIKPSNAANSSILHEDVQPLNQETLIISSRKEDIDSSMAIMLPNCEVRCRRWPIPVSPASCREFHLKQASIPLIRLDVESHMIPEGGTAELSTSPNGPFCDLEMESGACESEPCGSSSVNTESNHATQSTLISELKDRNSFPAHRQSKPCIRHSPFVVLERLDFAPGCGSTRSSFVLPRSISYNNYNGVELRQISCNMSSGNKNGKQCKHSLNYHLANEEESDVDSEDDGRNLSSEICDKSVCTARNIGNSSKGKELGPKQIITSKSLKRKHSDYSDRKAKFCHSFPHEKRNALEMENEEDPLEGPSWLYKDGMLEKTRLKKLEKIRKDYLIFHYMPPTVYPSSEESEDENTVEETTSYKLRKLRSARRS